MGGLPFGGQKLGMGAEKSSAKYGKVFGHILCL